MASAEVTLAVSTAERMRELGRVLGGLLRAGDLVILSGGLGAGKTTLTQGIGEGLGVRGPVTSPTFVIARVHPPLRAPDEPGDGPRPALVHADAYRLGSTLELDDLDLDADTASSVTVVEWGEGLAEGLSADRLEITLTPAAAVSAQEAGPDPAGAPGRAEPDAELADGLADIPRQVRIFAVGKRWEGVELPFADLAHRL